MFNQGLLLILLIVFNSGHGGPPYSQLLAQWVFRVSFGVMAFMTLWLGARLRLQRSHWLTDQRISDTTRKCTRPLR